MRTLTNNNIKTTIEENAYSLWLDDMKFTFMTSKNKSKTTLDIKKFIPVTDTDILVNFVDINHSDYIYWREANTDKIYERGLLEFDGRTLLQICSGEAGTESRH